MRRSVAEILFGQQQERLAVHFERVALDGPQRKLVFRPLEPLGYVISAPVNRLQACWESIRWREKILSATQVGQRGRGQSWNNKQNRDFMSPEPSVEFQGPGL